MKERFESGLAVLFIGACTTGQIICGNKIDVAFGATFTLLGLLVTLFPASRITKSA